jgi:integrase
VNVQRYPPLPAPRYWGKVGGSLLSCVYGTHGEGCKPRHANSEAELAGTQETLLPANHASSLHLGYYRGSRTGSWSARRFVGDGHYEESKLGTADDVADADGLTILSFAQAQERARDWFMARAKADAGHEEPIAAYTVANALDDYERDYVRRGGKAHDRLRHVINAHIRPALGAIELGKLSRRKIEGWLEALANTPARLRSRRGQAPRHQERDTSPEGIRGRRETANRILTVLKAALNLAYQHRKVGSKDGWEAVKPYREAASAKIRYLTDIESKRLIEACRPPFRELVLGALLTGARYGELAAMTVGDFDPANGMIQIPRSKSGKPRHVFLTEDGQRLFAKIAKGRVAAAQVQEPSTTGEDYG